MKARKLENLGLVRTGLEISLAFKLIIVFIRKIDQGTIVDCFFKGVDEPNISSDDETGGFNRVRKNPTWNPTQAPLLPNRGTWRK